MGGDSSRREFLGEAGPEPGAPRGAEGPTAKGPVGGAELAFLTALARCSSREEVGAALRRLGPEAFGARTVELALREPSLELRVIAVAGPQAEHPEGSVIPLDSRSLLARAVRMGDVQLAPFDRRSERGAGRCTLPLVTPDGRGVIGSLGLSFPPGLGLSGSLQRLRYLAEETACALERGKLMESEKRMRHRAQRSLDMLMRLQAVTAGLCGARRPEDVADVVIGTGVRELRADSGTMYLAGPRGGPPLPIRRLGAGGAPDPEEPGLVSEAMETARPVFVPSGDLDGSFRREDGSTRGALAVIPIVPTDAAVGAIVFRFRDDREFPQLERGALAALAGQCAQALERAQLYAERTHEARLLQQHLLPRKLPSIPGVETAVRYRPFGDGSMVGGDFYDVFAVDGSTWGITIGDVCGRGIPAASMTALARHAIRAMATSEESPSRILNRVNDIVLEEALEDAFFTVVQGFLRTTGDRARLRFAVAGHPRPIRVDAAGGLSVVGSTGMLIGALRAPHLRDEEIELAPGEALVLYTDGFIEARSPQGHVATGLIEEAIGRAAGRSAEGIADAVERAVLEHQGGTHRDDMALLVLRIANGAGPETSAGEGVRLHRGDGA